MFVIKAIKAEWSNFLKFFETDDIIWYTNEFVINITGSITDISR